ncbi:unnamed protein product [Mycena citricolor]|uniref:Transcription factor CBF/NF-Y/archaeal histone domain-containing protein n=1 Tax=Mycena citricolor TaxID=2018698 RepID=A0AAD2K434_9AGAR|nr:unnamed protein product [Mycena citricolor]CAK5277793.1 unnamed protein product [Mycena citricolor]
MSSSNSQPFVQPGEPLNDFLRSFWQRQIDAAEHEAPDYRHPPLPLARIKKVMKSDLDVKARRAGIYGSISEADALRVLIVCTHAEQTPYSADLVLQGLRDLVFIAEITARAFIIADSNKRRTLSRADIAKALTKSDQFDFLIDIVPRDEPLAGSTAASGSGEVRRQTAGVEVLKREPVASPLNLSEQSIADGEGTPDTTQRSEVLEQLESLLAAGSSGIRDGL